MEKTAINPKTEEDIRRMSQAMDALAKLIIEKRQDGTQLRLEYQHKIEKLNRLIAMILGLKQDEDNLGYELDTKQMDKLLRDDIEIIEKVTPTTSASGKTEVKRYALIPIVEQPQTSGANTKRRKKKKNKIACSFCNEQGHTRAKCEKKILYSKE